MWFQCTVWKWENVLVDIDKKEMNEKYQVKRNTQLKFCMFIQRNRKDRTINLKFVYKYSDMMPLIPSTLPV